MSFPAVNPLGTLPQTVDNAVSRHSALQQRLLQMQRDQEARNLQLVLPLLQSLPPEELNRALAARRTQDVLPIVGGARARSGEVAGLVQQGQSLGPGLAEGLPQAGARLDEILAAIQATPQTAQRRQAVQSLSGLRPQAEISAGVRDIQAGRAKTRAEEQATFTSGLAAGREQEGERRLRERQRNKELRDLGISNVHKLSPEAKQEIIAQENLARTKAKVTLASQKEQRQIDKDRAAANLRVHQWHEGLIVSPGLQPGPGSRTKRVTPAGQVFDAEFNAVDGGAGLLDVLADGNTLAVNQNSGVVVAPSLTAIPETGFFGDETGDFRPRIRVVVTSPENARRLLSDFFASEALSADRVAQIQSVLKSSGALEQILGAEIPEDGSLDAALIEEMIAIGQQRAPSRVRRR